MEAIKAEAVATLGRPWHNTARTKQLPPDHPRHHEPDGKGYKCGCDAPDHEWSVWLLMSGRGFGKTWIGSNWLVEQAVKYPGTEWAVLAPTFRDVRKTCTEGPTGILRAFGPGELGTYRRNEAQIILANGSKIYGFSADEPERLRGANLSGAWADELGSWRYSETWTAGLMPALRIGTHPRIVVTTTPRPTPLIRSLVKRESGSVHVTRGSTWENADNLSEVALAELEFQYSGSRLGRQELEGELLEDVEGALWSREQIDALRIRADELPEDLHRVVVGYDPAVTSGEDSDWTGIIVMAEGPGMKGYVLADYTMKGSPEACMRRAVNAYHEFKADCIVAEVNNGGDYIRAQLRVTDPSVPFKTVRATRGKLLRAQPLSAIYEQGRVHHAGSFPMLEDQMVSWVPESTESPDRLDALVWASAELKGLFEASWAAAFGLERCPKCDRVTRNSRCEYCGYVNA